MRCVRRWSVPALLLLLPAAVVAQTASPEGPPVRRGPSVAFVLEGAAEYGGDRFGETVFEDGSTQTMLAGQGGTGAVGVEVRPHRASPLAARATVGVKFVTTAANNADIMLTRIPVEVVGSYRLPREFWAGAGYVGHYRIRFEGDDFADDAAFDPAHGVTAEVGWRWAALTYTAIRYASESGDAFDASSVGVSLIARFGGR